MLFNTKFKKYFSDELVKNFVFDKKLNKFNFRKSDLKNKEYNINLFNWLNSINDTEKEIIVYRYLNYKEYSCIKLSLKLYISERTFYRYQNKILEKFFKLHNGSF